MPWHKITTLDFEKSMHCCQEDFNKETKKILGETQKIKNEEKLPERRKILFSLPNFISGLLIGALLVTSATVVTSKKSLKNLISPAPASLTAVSQSITLEKKYQELLNQVSMLNQKNISDPKTKSDIENIKKEVEALKSLNPYLKFKEIRAALLPSGVPEIYGKELNINFDNAQDAINKVAPLDPTYGKEKIILSEGNLKRYIKIGSLTACQYCCGAQTLVNEEGGAACGCEHSQMMRGLAAYLIKNNPTVSDEQILQEVNKWKAVFFPKQTISAQIELLAKAGEPGIKELLEEFPGFLPEMVGGC